MTYSFSGIEMLNKHFYIRKTIKNLDKNTKETTGAQFIHT